MRVTFSFVWYDLWAGIFIDTKKRRVYVCPLPCLLFTLHLPPKNEPSDPA